MYFYSIYCKSICTDLYFPQLTIMNECRKDECDIFIESGQMPEELIEKTQEKSYEFGADISWLSNKTCYLVIEGGRKITYTLKPGGNVQYLRTYILGWGISMLALQLNEMAIHCSTVTAKDSAVLICGESGAGKSTLTSMFLQNDWHLMCDDMALVEVADNVIVKPGFPYQKICKSDLTEENLANEGLIYIDETKDKYLVPCKDIFCDEPKQVKAIFVLCINNNIAGIQVAEIQGMQKFFAVCNNLFLRKLLGDEKYKKQIGQECLNIASKVPIYAIIRPESGDTRNQIWDAVTATISKL